MNFDTVAAFFLGQPPDPQVWYAGMYVTFRYLIGFVMFLSIWDLIKYVGRIFR